VRSQSNLEDRDVVVGTYLEGETSRCSSKSCWWGGGSDGR